MVFESHCYAHLMDPHAGSRPRLPDQLAARRRNYRRSQTVSALPISPDNELSERSMKPSNQPQVKATGDVDLRAFGELSPKVRRSADVLHGFKKSWSFRSTSPRQRVVLIGGCQTLLHPVGEKTRERLPLCRTPSSPSILLSKVREKIKEKVIETSVEWPSMAVIVQEKRQKAVSAFEAQFSHGVHGVLLVDHEDPSVKQNCASKLIVKKVLTQSRSTSGEITSVRERSRLELRRRSISMDTFERMSRPISGDKCLTSSKADLGGGGGGRGGGVVCTTNDLKSIMNSYREDTNRQNPANVFEQFKNVPRKSSPMRENNDNAAVATPSGLNLDNHTRPETDKNSNPVPSNDSGVPFSCAPLSESTSNANSTKSPQKLKATRPHMTLFRSSSANTSSVKAKSHASSNRKGFFFRRSASVCSTPCRERTSPVQLAPFHRLEKAPVAHSKTSSTIKDQAAVCLITGRTRFHSNCCSSPRKGKAGSEPGKPGLVYPSNDFDPEIIGQAIQVHLETMMRSRPSSGEHRK